jgi:citrate synthase
MSTETKPAYSPGLAGVVAGETEICWVDPNAGLMYRGYDIHEMAQKANFEEVAYLLLKGELPSADELAAFSKALAAERALPEPVLEMLKLMPKSTHPMDMLRTGVSMLGPFDPDLNDHSHASNVRKACWRVFPLWSPTAGEFPRDNSRLKTNRISRMPETFSTNSPAAFRRIGRSGCSTRFTFCTPITNSTRRHSRPASRLRRSPTCMRRSLQLAER